MSPARAQTCDARYRAERTDHQVTSYLRISFDQAYIYCTHSIISFLGYAEENARKLPELPGFDAKCCQDGAYLDTTIYIICTKNIMQVIISIKQ